MVTAWGGVGPGLGRTRQADRVGRKPLVGPLHSVKRPPGSFSDRWGLAKIRYRGESVTEYPSIPRDA